MHKMPCLSFIAALALSGCAVDGEDAPVGETASALTNCPVGPGQAAFYMGDQATGTCVILNQGAYPQSSYIGLTNDSIRSVRLGSLTRASLFADDFFSGGKTLVTQDTNGLGHNTSSLRVESIFDNCESPSYRPGAGAVALYKDINFHGDCVVVKNQEQDPVVYFEPSIPDCPDGSMPCPLGHFPIINFYPGLPAFSLSSAYIGPDTSITFFVSDFFGELPGFQTKSELMRNPTGFVQAQPDFRNTLIGNDTVNSMIVTFP